MHLYALGRPEVTIFQPLAIVSPCFWYNPFNVYLSTSHDMTPEFRISIETAVFHITMFWALQTNRRHDPTLCCLYKEDPLGEDAKILHPQPQLLHTPFI